jgi:hypothetical protein
MGRVPITHGSGGLYRASCHKVPAPQPKQVPALVDCKRPPTPGSAEHLDQLVEEIVAAAPPLTPEQRLRLVELLSVTPAMSWPKPSTARRAA